MRVEIINTGSELMLGYVLNTHQQWLCRELSHRGYIVTRQVAVSDTGEAIQQAVREALPRAEIIIATGGLGPTSDDRTRDMIAQLFGRALKEDPEIVKHIEEFFGRRKRQAPASTSVQALVPEGAIVLPNQNGTAPGLILEQEGRALIMLPGPPRELRPMFTDQVAPWLDARFGQREAFACTVLKSTGLGESFLEERVSKWLDPLVAKGLEVGYCARVGEVDLRLVARGPQAAEIVAEAERISTRLLKHFIYGREPDQLESVVVRLLSERKQTLALAESCTGGFIANRITNVPGASAVLLAGLVTYSNEAKEQFLGVRRETLAQHGAVSEPVAREMADGVRARTGADFAIAVTGIAGPTGGTPEKPLGTVFIALASATEAKILHQVNQYDRETFKFVTSQQALNELRRLLKVPAAAS